MSADLCRFLDKFATNPSYELIDIDDMYLAILEYSKKKSAGEIPKLKHWQTESFLNTFPPMIQRAAELTSEYVKDDRKSLELNELVSCIDTITNDLFEVYKTATNGEKISDGIYSVIKNLQEQRDKIQQQIA